MATQNRESTAWEKAAEQPGTPPWRNFGIQTLGTLSVAP